MTLVPQSDLRTIGGISDDEITAIRNFLQGAVYCWCKNRPDEWFSLRDLMGGENTRWAGTPLLALYEKHEGSSEDPVLQAGQDGGWLLKRVISEDLRRFETREAYRIREYHWLRDGNDE